MKPELKSLAKVVKILNKNKIHFWMYGGALLGYHRDGNLLPWDGDIDLFIWQRDFKKLIKIQERFDMRHYFKEYTLALRAPKGEKNVDILPFENNGKKAFFERLSTKNLRGRILYFGLLSRAIKHGWLRTANFVRWLIIKTGGAQVIRQEVPLHFFRNMKTINLFGVKLKVPRETEAFFEYTFGKGWKTPQREFNREGKCHPDYYQVVKK